MKTGGNSVLNLHHYLYSAQPLSCFYVTHGREEPSLENIQTQNETHRYYYLMFLNIGHMLAK